MLLLGYHEIIMKSGTTVVHSHHQYHQQRHHCLFKANATSPLPGAGFNSRNLSSTIVSWSLSVCFRLLLPLHHHHYSLKAFRGASGLMISTGFAAAFFVGRSGSASIWRPGRRNSIRSFELPKRGAADKESHKDTFSLWSRRPAIMYHRRCSHHSLTNNNHNYPTLTVVSSIELSRPLTKKRPAVTAAKSTLPCAAEAFFFLFLPMPRRIHPDGDMDQTICIYPKRSSHRRASGSQSLAPRCLLELRTKSSYQSTRPLSSRLSPFILLVFIFHSRLRPFLASLVGHPGRFFRYHYQQ